MKNKEKPIATEKAIEGMLNEWKRSMLTFWTLSLLLIRPMYGLEIKKEIESSTQGMITLGTSTIYQLLRRLEKRGLVESRWERTSQGPPRAYYTVTPAGVQVVARFCDDILSPTSPIAAALGQLTGQIFQHLRETGHQP